MFQKAVSKIYTIALHEYMDLCGNQLQNLLLTWGQLFDPCQGQLVTEPSLNSCRSVSVGDEPKLQRLVGALYYIWARKNAFEPTTAHCLVTFRWTLKMAIWAYAYSVIKSNKIIQIFFKSIARPLNIIFFKLFYTRCFTPNGTQMVVVTFTFQKSKNKYHPFEHTSQEHPTGAYIHPICQSMFGGAKISLRGSLTPARVPYQSSSCSPSQLIYIHLAKPIPNL